MTQIHRDYHLRQNSVFVKVEVSVFYKSVKLFFNFLFQRKFARLLPSHIFVFLSLVMRKICQKRVLAIKAFQQLLVYAHWGTLQGLRSWVTKSGFMRLKSFSQPPYCSVRVFATKHEVTFCHRHVHLVVIPKLTAEWPPTKLPMHYL